MFQCCSKVLVTYFCQQENLHNFSRKWEHSRQYMCGYFYMAHVPEFEIYAVPFFLNIIVRWFVLEMWHKLKRLIMGLMLCSLHSMISYNVNVFVRMSLDQRFPHLGYGKNIYTYKKIQDSFNSITLMIIMMMSLRSSAVLPDAKFKKSSTNF